jgi:hypothetical protein
MPWGGLDPYNYNQILEGNNEIPQLVSKREIFDEQGLEGGLEGGARHVSISVKAACESDRNRLCPSEALLQRRGHSRSDDEMGQGEPKIKRDLSRPAALQRDQASRVTNRQDRATFAVATKRPNGLRVERDPDISARLRIDIFKLSCFRGILATQQEPLT